MALDAGESHATHSGSASAVATLAAVATQAAESADVDANARALPATTTGFALADSDVYAAGSHAAIDAADGIAAVSSISSGPTDPSKAFSARA